MPLHSQLLAILTGQNLTAEFIKLTSLSISHIKKKKKQTVIANLMRWNLKNIPKNCYLN